MKWHAWNKWPLLGVAVTAVVLAAPDDGAEGEKAALAGKPQQLAPVRQPAAPLPSPAVARETARPEPQAIRVELERLQRAKPEAVTAEMTEVANAFNPVSWYEPPPPPPTLPQQPEPEQVPVAPPLPFTYFGRYEDPPTQIVMLAKGEQIYTVSEGDVIDDIYRIEQISDGAVALVYLPLGINQTISMGVQ